MTYYISGSITQGDTATPEEIARNMEMFAIEETRLQNEGFIVFNPARQGVGDRYEKYIVTDVLPIIDKKPIMLMLPNWKDSLGARIEHELAERLSLTIEYK